MRVMVPMTRMPRSARKRFASPSPRRFRCSRGFIHGLLGAVPFTLGACSPDRGEGFRNAEVHPNEENAAPSHAGLISQDSLPAGLGPGALSAWREARNDLVGARTVLRIGTEERGPQLFGIIGDAKLDAGGNLLVFDAQAKELRVFDPGGRHVDGFGGVGDAPLELRYAHMGKFDVLGDGRILVANGRRTKLFSRAEERWTLDKIVEAPDLAFDVCAMNDDQAFFAGWRSGDNTLIQPASLVIGTMDPGFANGYQHEHYLVKFQMAQGIGIACLPGTGQVILGWGYLPIIQSYSIGDRTVGWTSRVDGYLPSRVLFGSKWNERTGGESLAVSDRSDRQDLLSAIVPMPSGHVLIQYERGGDGIPSVRRTYLVDAATGLGAFLGHGLPAVASVQTDGYVATFLDPYPRLEVRKYR